MDRMIWLTTRAAGVTAYLLLFAVVALGLVLSRRRAASWARGPVNQLHVYLTWLLGGFVALHVLILLVDGFIHFGVLDLLVPFRSAYEPLWTGIGVLALYAVVAVTLTSIAAVRRRLRYPLWRAIHLLSFPAFAGATAHGIMAGSDGREGWMVALYVLCGLAIAGLLIPRLGDRMPARDPGLRWATGAAAAVAVCGLLFFTLALRLTSSPEAAGGVQAAVAAPVSPDAVRVLPSMTEQLSATSSPAGRGATEINGTLDGDLPAAILVTLQPPRAQGGRGRGGAGASAGDVEIRDANGQLLFYGSALVRDGRLTLQADGQGAYAGVVLRLSGTVDPGAATLTTTLTGGMQRLSDARTVDR
jgi:cytochrome b561